MKSELAAMIQLAASGNSSTVEELWMAALERHGDDPDQVASWTPLLTELADRERAGEAEALAWAALETIEGVSGPKAALTAAGPFLLALNNSAELKTSVAKLYAAAYTDRENFEALLDEAGIAGGRPPRRALRTLDVCLNLEPNGYLVARHEHEAARVVSVDADTWEVTIHTTEGEETLGPVELADQYAVADENDFQVMLHFAPDRLAERLAKAPDEVVIGILRSQGNRLDSESLRELLTPKPLAAGEWSKWWTKARSALKRNPNVKVTGRAPYELTYNEVAVTLEAETEIKLKKLHDPMDHLACLEAYFRECKSRGHDADLDVVKRACERYDRVGARRRKPSGPSGLVWRLVSRGMAVMLGASEEEADQPVVEFFAATPNPAECLNTQLPAAHWPTVCRCLQAAHPEEYLNICRAVLPHAPTGACDLLARALREGGWGPERFDELVQQVCRKAVEHVDALVWLWNGPDAELGLPVPPLPTLCAKLLAVAAELRRRDEMPRKEKKRVQDCVRDALSADQFGRFKECLSDAGPGVAGTWCTLIGRLDNLGRAVPEDMVKLIRAKFPVEQRTPEISPWKRDDVLYMTAEGRAKLRREIDDLTVKMRENAKAIGEAASHGDLSENSEYKFALEERDLLRARMANYQEQMSLAEVLGAEDIPADQVGFGTRVTLRETGADETFQATFLGPWEADVDHNVFNYRSPVGQELMGLALGASIRMNFAGHDGEFTVERLENALTAPLVES